MSSDELERVERHLNQGNPLSGWLGIRLYRLRRNPSGKLKNILTIGVSNNHMFLINDIARVARTCAHS